MRSKQSNPNYGSLRDLLPAAEIEEKELREKEAGLGTESNPDDVKAGVTASDTAQRRPYLNRGSLIRLSEEFEAEEARFKQQTGLDAESNPGAFVDWYYEKREGPALPAGPGECA